MSIVEKIDDFVPSEWANEELDSTVYRTEDPEPEEVVREEFVNPVEKTKIVVDPTVLGDRNSITHWLIVKAL